MSRFKKAWEDSYSRKENTLFYPQEEVVRFVNRYIRRRTGIDCWSLDFDEPPIFLDLGSGAGRHLAFLYENGFFPVGIELSERACEQAKELMDFVGADPSEFAIHAVTSTQLQLEDSSASYGIAVSSLDSMTTDEAQQSISEVRRVLKPGGIFYADVIGFSTPRMGQIDNNLDQVVDEAHELGTIQSYYDEAKIAYVFAGLEIIRLEKIARMTATDELVEVRWHGVFRHT